jgi:fatty-acyl-CoA synthase
VHLAPNGERKFTWSESYKRCKQLASALERRGVGEGDVVAVMLPNIPEMFEAHNGVPMCGGILNSINTRLDAATVAYILDHGGAKGLLVDYEFAVVAAEAIQILKKEGKPFTGFLIDVTGEVGATTVNGTAYSTIGDATYESMLLEGDESYVTEFPKDEFDAIALNYTSGTTGNPKGVVLHHRGAHLTAASNCMVWQMPHQPVYLWTLPMFHCNGWCFPWTIPALGGTHVCLRDVNAEAIFEAFSKYGVTHFCGAPIILGMLLEASEELKAAHPFEQKVEMMTAASPPPAKVLQKAADMGLGVTHVYGLTEVYGPATVCAWHPEWDAESDEKRAQLNSRQGVRYHTMEGLKVADPETMKEVEWDGKTLGEVMMRGNQVMKGYHNNPSATEEAFEGGWFHTGDLACVDPDGYIALKDRSKDIIISGGENISTIEIENTLYMHPAVLDAAVVGRPDEKWGETPCAFVVLRPDAAKKSEDEWEQELIKFCKDNMARFKCPKTVVFGDLPKTNTGKIQKFVLRDQAKAL